jgi:hypothetical protein
MISYLHLLGIVTPSQTVLHKQATDLLDLIRLRVASPRLQVQNLHHAVLDALINSQATEQVPQVIEGDVGVGTTAHDPKDEIIVLRHQMFLQQCPLDAQLPFAPQASIQDACRTPNINAP